jgi:hypothetical protein
MTLNRITRNRRLTPEDPGPLRGGRRQTPDRFADGRHLVPRFTRGAGRAAPADLLGSALL